MKLLLIIFLLILVLVASAHSLGDTQMLKTEAVKTVERWDGAGKKTLQDVAIENGGVKEDTDADADVFLFSDASVLKVFHDR